MPELMLMTFGEYVKETRERNGWTIAYLANRAGMVWPRLKRIEEDEPKRSDGSPPQPRRETVEKLAAALNRPMDEALAAAGYAPTEKPSTPAAFIIEGDQVTVGAGERRGEAATKEDMEMLRQQIEDIKRLLTLRWPEQKSEQKEED